LRLLDLDESLRFARFCIGGSLFRFAILRLGLDGTVESSIRDPEARARKSVVPGLFVVEVPDLGT
jgi:hypothetical protein